MNAIEAMAIAHWDWGACRKSGTPLWMHLDDEQREFLTDQMRAALVALRDCGVTEGMREAYDDMDGMGGSPDNCFRAMLDAAIEGE